MWAYGCSQGTNPVRRIRAVSIQSEPAPGNMDQSIAHSPVQDSKSIQRCYLACREWGGLEDGIPSVPHDLFAASILVGQDEPGHLNGPALWVYDIVVNRIAGI